MASATALLRRFFRAFCVLLPSFPVHAVIVMGASDPAGPPPLPGAAALLEVVGHLHHTNAPGSLATAIAPRHFLTAAHLAFGSEDSFLLQDREFRIVGRTNLPGSDLALGEVDEDLPAFVPLYDREDEIHRTVLVFGNGRWKGEAIDVDGALKGWRHAEAGPPGIRWGTNVVSRYRLLGEPTPEGLSGFLLSAEFNRGAGDHEVHLTFGDSGAPVFLDDCGTWKLAAVASAVDGPFRLRPPGEGAEAAFLAALFDRGGLYERSENGATYRLVKDEPSDLPSSWHASRVAPRVAELRILAGLPLPQAPLRPPEIFVWRDDGDTVVPLEDAILDSGTDGNGTCFEPRTRGGASVTLGGSGVVIGPPPRPVDVDSVRYVIRGDDGGSTWGTVYLFKRKLLPAEPTLVFDPAGTAVVLWPVLAAGGNGVVAETADGAAGPWDDAGRPVVRWEDRWAFVDERGAEYPGGSAGRFYRLRLSGAGEGAP